MTGSPFSNVVGHDPDDSTYQRALSTQTTDTTDRTASRPPDRDTESSVGVEVQGGVTQVAGEDETAGDAPSGS